MSRPWWLHVAAFMTVSLRSSLLPTLGFMSPHYSSICFPVVYLLLMSFASWLDGSYLLGLHDIVCRGLPKLPCANSLTIRNVRTQSCKEVTRWRQRKWYFWRSGCSSCTFQVIHRSKFVLCWSRLREHRSKSSYSSPWTAPQSWVSTAALLTVKYLGRNLVMGTFFSREVSGLILLQTPKDTPRLKVMSLQYFQIENLRLALISCALCF